MTRRSELQIGKNGLTQEFIVNLKTQFESHENVRITILKSATRDRETLKKMEEEILAKLGPHYTAKVIGFTIALRRWRKPVRE